MVQTSVQTQRSTSLAASIASISTCPCFHSRITGMIQVFFWSMTPALFENIFLSLLKTKRSENRENLEIVKKNKYQKNTEKSSLVFHTCVISTFSMFLYCFLYFPILTIWKKHRWATPINWLLIEYYFIVVTVWDFFLHKQ